MSVERSPQLVSIDEFVRGLCAIPDADFGIGTVYDFIAAHPVDQASLDRYLFFSAKHYTRNLIFKDERFELITICWDVGQASQIHNHHGQNCWMAIPIGRLRVQNFRVLDQNETTGYCCLEPTSSLDIHRLLPAEVDPAEPVHQVLNLAEFNRRAVSLHVYSRPYDRCLVYGLDTNEYREIPLHYTSEYGQLCEGQKL
ncbi:MAG TPA: cysteine dioxygenase family protein [Blastocatellia bacterium]|nr:cysteine dioxygenase family protein [Blastocatellia bacterium]